MKALPQKKSKSPRENIRIDVSDCKLTRNLLFLFVSFFLLIIPWFHGASGLQVQLFIQTILYAMALCMFFFPLAPSAADLSESLTSIDEGVLLTGSMLVLSIVLSALPFYSLMTAVRFGAVIVFFLIVRLLCKTDAEQNNLLRFFLAAGVFYSIYGLLQLNGFLLRDYWYETNSLASRYVNSGHFAGFLVMPFFAAMILFVLTRVLFFRITLLIAFLFLGIVLVMTRSRTVWVSLTMGFFCFLFFMNGIKPISRKFYLLLGAGASAIFSAAFFSGIINSVLTRFLELKSLDFFSIYHRFHFWEGSLRAIMARPWGWGLGTFVHVFPQFRVHTDRFIVDYAHNELLQIGVDLGVFGICLFAGLFFFYVKISWQAIKAPEHSYSDKVKIAGIAACMCTLVIASQFDFPMRIYATAFFAAALLGIQSVLMQKAARTVEFSPLLRGLVKILFCKKKIVLGVLTLLGLGLSGTYLYAESAYQQGRRFEMNFDWDLASRQYRLSGRFAPWASEYDEAGGRLAEKRAALMMVPAERQRWLESALGFYASAAQKNEFWPGSFYKAAVISKKLGDQEKAEEYLREAQALDPRNPLYTFEYGLKRLQRGQIEEGVTLLESFVKGGYYDPVPLSQSQILEMIFPFVQEPVQLRRIIFKGAYALHDFALFLLGKGLLKEGTAALHEAQTRISDENGYLFYLDHFGVIDAEACSQVGLYSEAAAIYEEAVKRSPNPEAYQGYWKAILNKMQNL